MLTMELFSQLRCINNIWAPADKIELKINTDSRSFQAGETFVALCGENFDGYNYLEQVLKMGAAGVVYNGKAGRAEQVLYLRSTYPKAFFVEVSDTLIFIQTLASAHITQWRSKKKERKIIGVTGSNGKTTHKEMIASLLSALFPGKVLATKGNLNNHIGVPLTIFKISDDHDIAVIEMGMNHPGEIGELCQIAHPEHGMITNIGPAHIEFMKSIENIFKEKSSLYLSVVENAKGIGSFVVNSDDPWLNKLAPSKGLTTYGEESGDVRIKRDGQQVSFRFNNEEFSFTNENLLEPHNLKNLAGVSLLVMKLYPDKMLEIIKAASDYHQPNMNRSQWVENIYLDAYNANPSSMRVSLDSFLSIMNNKSVSLEDCYFVIGDMNELGDFSRELHREMGSYLKQIGIKNITFLGRFKEFYLEGFPNATSAYAKKEQFADEWRMLRSKYKFIFVKASRSLQLETLLSIV